MNVTKLAVATAVVLAGLLTVAGLAATAAKSYQVTGPVIAADDTKIVVETKDGEKWEIAKDAETRIEGGEVKVGEKVTIKYFMTATTVEVKGAAKEGKSSEPKPPKKSAKSGMKATETK